MTNFTAFARILALSFAWISVDGPAAAAAQAPEETPPAAGEDKEEMPVYGETVVVTASRTEEKISDASVSITVIGPERLEASPADNYADQLRGVPGLNVVQFSARDVNFTSRGATSSLSTGQLALLDGRSVYQDFFGFVAWDFLPVNFDEVKQIEVLRAPGSAIWGANALNGVINVRTKSPREIVGGEVMFGGGERDTLQFSGRYADAFELWSYKLSASYYEQKAWERPDTLPSGAPLPPGFGFKNEGTKQPKFDLRVDYDPAPGEQWSFGGGGGFTSGLIHTGIGPFAIDEGTGVVFAKAGYRNGAFDASAYVNRLDGDGRNLINGLDFLFENTTVSGESTYRQNWGEKQVLVFGGSLRGNFFDLSIAPRDDRRTELGVYLEDQVHLNEYVHFNLGARVDWFDTIGTTFSPRTGLVLKPHPDHSFRLAYNRAYRAPSLVNNFLETSIPNLIILPPPIGAPFVFVTGAVGNADLDEEVIDAFELGYTVNVARRATLSAAVYRNRTKDLIDFAPVGFYSPTDAPAGWPLPPALLALVALPKTFSYRNVGEVVDKGLELAADVQVVPGFNLTASYTFQAEPDAEIEGEKVDPGTVVNIPPRHQWSLNLSGARDRYFGSVGVTFTDDAFWQDVLDARFHGATESYALLNASFGVKLGGHYVLAVRGTNLTDEAAQQHVFGDIIGRRVTGEARARF